MGQSTWHKEQSVIFTSQRATHNLQQPWQVYSASFPSDLFILTFSLRSLRTLRLETSLNLFF